MIEDEEGFGLPIGALTKQYLDQHKLQLLQLIADIYKAGYVDGSTQGILTGEKIQNILIEYGQKDLQFKLGEKIMYDPVAVGRIIDEYLGIDGGERDESLQKLGKGQK